MNRRNFFTSLTAGVAGLALNEAIPFGRVWSFPSNLVIARHPFNFIAELERSWRHAADLCPELFKNARLRAFRAAELCPELLKPGDIITIDSVNLVNPRS